MLPWEEQEKRHKLLVMGYKSPFYKAIFKQNQKVYKRKEKIQKNELLNIFQKRRGKKKPTKRGCGVGGTQFQHAEQ